MSRNDFDRLVSAFHMGARFLKCRVDQDGWLPTANFIREYVRCTTGMEFSNTLSPQILAAVRKKYPELKPYIPLTKQEAKASRKMKTANGKTDTTALIEALQQVEMFLSSDGEDNEMWEAETLALVRKVLGRASHG